MKHPRSLQKAQAEIDAMDAAGSLSSPIKHTETTTKLPFVTSCIKEAMRLHPSVGLSMQRLAPAEGIELAGKFIPQGYRIGVNPAVVHYDKDTFGADANQFRPERWLVSEESFKAMERVILTFGAGTRTCIGKNVGFLAHGSVTYSQTQISLAELYKLVPEVLRHFDLEMAHDRPWTTKNRWFNKQTNVFVNVKRRAR
jgi:hypothetical protein